MDMHADIALTSATLAQSAFKRHGGFMSRNQLEKKTFQLENSQSGPPT